MVEQKKIRLHQVATELNVGKDSIVDFLNKSGFELSNKPTSIITEQMIETLLKGFIKERKIAENFRKKFGKDSSASASVPETKPTIVEETITTESVIEEKIEDFFAEEVIKEPPKKEVIIEVPIDSGTILDREFKGEEIVIEEPKTTDTFFVEPSVGEVIDLTKFTGRKERVKEKPKEEEIPKPKAKEEKKKVEKVPSKPPKAKPAKIEFEEPVKVEEKTPQAQESLPIIETPTIPELLEKEKIEVLDQVESPTSLVQEVEVDEEKQAVLEKESDIQVPQEEEEDVIPLVKEKWLRKRGGKTKLEKYKPFVDKKLPKRKTFREFIKESEPEIERNIRETLYGTEESDIRRRAKLRHKRKEEKLEKELQLQEELDKQKKILSVTEFITTAELAKLLGVDPTEVVQKCFELGLIVSLNQRLDRDTISIIAYDFGFEVEFAEEKELQIKELDFEDPADKLQPRPPIVTIMGHVDHGKTSLLDYIRKSNIVAGEAGGITQHIGAYRVEVPGKGFITFIDTPGHEAFTAMRARGAMVTDIVVLVVAADDAVMPQTIEAINHARAANVPIIVAINKIDKPDANPDRIRQQLSEIGILVEEWQGTYQSVEISAKYGTNVDLLLEKILLEAELLDLKANPDRAAKATIVESHLDRGKGPVATAIVQKGTLKIGDVFVVGLTFGRVRAMYDERERKIDLAGPSAPVRIVGFDDLPEAGDILYVVENEQIAKQIAGKRQQIKREQALRKSKVVTLDDLSKEILQGNVKELNLILKTDVTGSLEALTDSLSKLSNEEVKINILHKGVGNVNESDVTLAAASNAVVLAFQVSSTGGARKLAEKLNVEIRRYEIIYELLNEVKLALEGLLSPDIQEVSSGTIEVRRVFKISKVGTIAGCYVLNGKVTRNDKVRILRDGLEIFKGTIASLKRNKDDVREVDQGYECGIMVDKFNDFKEGDIIEAYKIVEIKRTLDNK
ncbi:MAG: translation initiation factor IF-2 [Ignavibacteria bacterium]|nr:translation initiation factor IF-2 [Ignavibacteria bacterium]